MTSFPPNQSPNASEKRTGTMLKNCYQAVKSTQLGANDE